MELLGYVAIILAGICTGLIGAGGSILTVPILVYLFAINPVTATAYSLFVVGTTSLTGTFPKYKNGNVSLKMAVVFGIPSMISIFLVRKFVLPQLPEIVFTIGNFQVSKSMFLMLFFAVLMIFASYSTLKKRRETSNLHIEITEIQPFFVSLLGFIEGAITGLVGAGGGFIIIPILTLLAKLDIKKAIGTSLLIIGIKSVIGFSGDIISAHFDIDWLFLIKITLVCIFGMFIGNALSKKIDGSKLKTGFGWFILVMGIYIIMKELVL
ncbi:MAG: sulfite exporter TauE/SafE family protein [Flavobacteriaceae bacterium]